MAINIKELFNADADNIKVDKINYNFDQLILSGGGPSGIKGDTGLTGNTGLKGEKGDIGSKGEEGTKGEQGSSANLWDRDTILSASGDVDVYRPYDNASGLRSRIVLGESTVLNSQIPPSDTDSLLNLTLPPATNNDVSSQIIFSNDEPGDPKDFKMSTFYQAGVGTKFTFGATSATGNENTNLLIDIPDDIEITAGNKVGISSTNSSVNIAAPTLIELDADDDINMYAGSQVEVEAPEITIQGPGGAGGTIDISSFTNTIGAPQVGGTNTMFAQSKNTINSTGNNEIISDGGDNLIEQLNGGGTNVIRANSAANIITAQVNTITSTSSSSGSAGNIIETTSSFGVKNVLRNGSNDSFFTTSQLNTSRNSILFDQDGGVLDGTNALTDYGKGVEFVEGGALVGNPQQQGNAGLYAAPNSASDSYRRRFSDYYYQDSITEYNGGDYLNHCGLKIANNATATIAGDGDFSNYGNLSNITEITAEEFEISYVKTGHLIHAWGRGQVGFQFYTSQSTDPLVISLSNGFAPDNQYIFPYVSDCSFYIDVDVNLRLSVSTAEMTTTRDDHDFKIMGRLYPGQNRIYLWKQGLFYDGSNAKWHFVYLSAADIIGTNGNASLTYSFKFAMPALFKSYNRKDFGTANFN